MESAKIEIKIRLPNAMIRDINERANECGLSATEIMTRAIRKGRRIWSQAIYEFDLSGATSSVVRLVGDVELFASLNAPMIRSIIHEALLAQPMTRRRELELEACRLYEVVDAE